MEGCSVLDPARRHPASLINGWQPAEQQTHFYWNELVTTNFYWLPGWFIKFCWVFLFGWGFFCTSQKAIPETLGGKTSLWPPHKGLLLAPWHRRLWPPQNHVVLFSGLHKILLERVLLYWIGQKSKPHGFSFTIISHDKQLETSMAAADTRFIGTVWVRDIKLPVFPSAPCLHSWMHQVVALDKTN